MEYLIIGLLIVILIMIILLLLKNGTDSTIERLGKLETTTVKELGEFKSDIFKKYKPRF